MCISKLTTISSYNGLSPGRRQAIIWTDGGILLIRPLGDYKLQTKFILFIKKCFWNCHLQNGSYFVLASMSSVMFMVK